MQYKDIINKLLEPKNVADTEFYETGREWQGFDVGMIPKEQRYRRPAQVYGVEYTTPNKQIFEDFLRYMERFFRR